ncbi:ras GEF [Pleurotus eryngii]|uniref:Ras GEF n=1 Tax=Pleurotus eryngii TaxID=5323 RepID=A0A9P5ZK05_PLEER|nr:ras GEF [Pleurotus eryngii]
MATVVQPMYGAHHNGFISNTPATSSQQHSVNLHQPQQQPDAEQLDDEFPLFCRALYDYQAQDASALSFRRNDIIEILTQQPSGWWDGLLGDERGWFPSNYVTIISEDEAEAAFSSTDRTQPVSAATVENEEWLERELGTRDGIQALANATIDSPAQSNDFWMPQVTVDGQIYYVNTQTGQHSRDLPQESDDQISDSELAGLTSQSSSRSGTSAGLGLTPSSSTLIEPSDGSVTPGFGLQRRTGTPEPWVRKLADDGMSYYYWNPVDNQVQWTRPEAEASVVVGRGRSDSQPTQRSGQLSVYSDDSDIQPNEGNRTARSQWKELTPVDDSTSMELTSAERLAQTLQQALSPSPPEIITDLSAIARNSIQAVVDSIQLNGVTRQPEEDEKMDGHVRHVVLSVRNLLYVAAIPTGHIPSNVLPPDLRNLRPNPTVHSQLKSAQRKVTATLSKLVLSARAMQYDTGGSIHDTPNRIEGDAEELERAIVSFVLEVQRFQHQEDSPQQKHIVKRLHGVFSTANIGLGLVGAGAAGSWKGFGWVSLDNEQEVPRRVLGSEVVNELSSFLSQLDETLSAINTTMRNQDPHKGKDVASQGQSLLSKVSGFLLFISHIHVARHVDIDGIRQEAGALPNELYSGSVEKARILVRALETSLQSLYDDAASIVLAMQLLSPLHPTADDIPLELVDTLVSSLKANLGVVNETLEGLLVVGHEQAELAQGDYTGSIEWRMSRLSMIDTQLGGALSPTSPSILEQEDVVDMDFAFSKQGSKLQTGVPSVYEDPSHEKSKPSRSIVAPPPLQVINGAPMAPLDQVLASPVSPDGPMDQETATLFEDEVVGVASPKSPPRAAGAEKLRKLLGDDAPRHYLDTVSADSKPWYLRPNYDQTEIQMDPDGSVRGGTVQALVERLTAHEHGDSSFIKTFLLTYKSFTTLDELFNLLVQRFRIQPPPNLSPPELEDWGKLKQHVIQMRVLNTLKSMITDEDVLEREDYHIFDRMKEFISSGEVSRFAASKQLLLLIERAQKGGDNIKSMVSTLAPAPPPIYPRISSGRKVKLLDVDPLELARQLTILESQLYQKIKPMECLQRSREQSMEHHDNIAIVIQTSNRIADWVADSILSKEDSRRRAAAVKHFISVADRCRTLHNFSTMVAITSGLNTPPIRRLKRTWEQVNQKLMAQLGACEMTIDTTRNFNNYRSTMATVTPPCVPFIGVFLTTLQFIQDGNPDNLAGSLVNFRKRQKAMEVINDIKRWQAQPFNFTPIPAVLQFIEESLSQFSETVDVREHFWQLSLDREPREREDEKMARLLQESGFL